MKCCFCGAELEKVVTPLPLDSEYLFCPIDDCHNEPLKREIWQALIDGKEAQKDLECMKHNYSVLSEQREIAYQNYLKITADLQEKLKSAQDALKEIANHDINEQRGEPKSYVIGYEEIKEMAITSITKQENE